ncbi:MAG TPA: hypothetical protein VGP90_09640, partial [Acidimicrobiia bacterium]|nr:hypothetical protein [Acidimicrobiia bacterium]
RVLALQAIVFLGSTPIGGPIVGAISERFGARYGIAIGAVATMAASAFGFAVVRRNAAAALPAEPIPLTGGFPGEPGLIDPLITPKAS